MTPEELAIITIESCWGPKHSDKGDNWYDPQLEAAIAKVIKDTVEHSIRMIAGDEPEQSSVTLILSRVAGIIDDDGKIQNA